MIRTGSSVSFPFRLRAVVFPVLLLCLPVGAVLADPAPESEKPANRASDPVDVDLTENVEVNLAEVQILLTDKKGNPVTDLKRTEVHVFENGVEQKVAFLETVEGIRDTAPIPKMKKKRLELEVGDLPGMVSNEPGNESGLTILPPKATRRIVFAFDVQNSKRNIRENWKEAALNWVKYEMRPGDRIGVVVFQSYPEWLLEFSGSRREIYAAIQGMSLMQGVADRDRSRDMNALVTDIYSLCSDPMGEGYQVRGRSTTRGKKAVDELSCSYNVAEGFVQQWQVDSAQTVETLRTLTGQLAAVPGRKAVMLFSEGFISDAATLGAAAMTAVFGVKKIDQRYVQTRMSRNVLRELDKLHSVAREARVSFFTLDTGRGNDSGFGGHLEIGAQFAQDNLGVNPWNEMRWESRGSLTTLAKESGGRSFRGVKDLEENLATAADSFFGQYRIGYYRSGKRLPDGKVRVKIDRKKIDITYSDRPTPWPHKPSMVVMAVSVGKPRQAGEADRQVIPLALTMNVDDLPLRRGGGGQGTQLGVFLQARREDGEIVAESLETVTVAMDRDRLLAARGKKYRHFTKIVLPEGTFRLHARLSDDRQKIIADRSLDMDVSLGEIRVLGTAVD